MKRLIVAAVAAFTLPFVPAGVAHAEPSIPLCTFGGEVPCFCPDNGGQMRTTSWQTCGSVQYGPWGDDQS